MEWELPCIEREIGILPLKKGDILETFSVIKGGTEKNFFEGSEGEDNYNKKLLDILVFSPDLKKHINICQWVCYRNFNESPLKCLL